MKAANTKAAKPAAKPAKPVGAVAEALKALKALGTMDGKRDDKLKLAASAIIVAYPTRESWDAMPKETLLALRAAYASGRLSSADFKVWSTPVKGMTDAAKAERLALHRDINTAWNRVIGHAYPKAKTVSAEGDKTEEAKTEEEKTEGAASPDQWAKILSTMLTQAQKAEGLKNVDLVGFQSALRTARSFVTLTSAE
jgi:hypothetical protein